MHTFNYPYTIPQALLAEKVCTTIGMDKIYFQNSGTEANEAMIKMARKYGVEKYGPHKYNIVTAKMGFHGRTFGFHVGNRPAGQRLPDRLWRHDPRLYLRRLQRPGILPQCLHRKHHCDYGRAGFRAKAAYIRPPREFLCGLRQLCDEKGMLLLLGRSPDWLVPHRPRDELHALTASSPTSFPWPRPWGGEHADRRHPALRPKLPRRSPPVRTAPPSGGHPVSAAAALAEIDELLSRDLASNAEKMGDYFAAKLETLPACQGSPSSGLPARRGV